MYQLTDYNLSALRIIQAANEQQIQDITAQISLYEKYFPAGIRDNATAKDRHSLSVLREHNVHLLTAISIVKDRETVNSN